MKNLHASDFIDKCTSRFQFECQAVDIYEIVLTKCPQQLRGRFEKILKQEQKHASLLAEVLEKYDANPYSLTPSAKVIGLESHGIMKSARKSDFRGLMDVLLSIELTDTANWELLLLLSDKVRAADTHAKFQKCLSEETEHLKFIHQHIVKDLTGKRVA